MVILIVLYSIFNNNNYSNLNNFQRQLTKSVAFFAFGVYLARDLSSVNLFENA